MYAKVNVQFCVLNVLSNICASYSFQFVTRFFLPSFWFWLDHRQQHLNLSTFPIPIWVPSHIEITTVLFIHITPWYFDANGTNGYIYTLKNTPIFLTWAPPATPFILANNDAPGFGQYTKYFYAIEKIPIYWGIKKH